jgi:phospholipid/cholesterol/gamma-HCH transport system ATP-binding protein
MSGFDEVAISVENVTKTFGEQFVLKNLDFKIYKGTITTVLGFSGAGKSTLLKHILGLLHPTQGSISVLGINLKNLSKIELRAFRRNFGMLFQYAALFDSMTTFDNVAFPLREFSNFSEADIKLKVEMLLDSVGIDQIAYKKYPSELSGGMRKRVGLARALALEPAIMLYDEPTTGLDPITTQMVNDLIVQTSHAHKDRSMTSVIISHDVKASLAISDFIAFLDRGKIVEYLPATEFRNSKNPLVQEFLELC